MLKFGFIFIALNWFIGNPLITIIVMFIALYALDHRFVGIFPNIFKPLKRQSRIRKLKQIIHSSPNDVSAKQELARLLIERRRYREALAWLEPLKRPLEDSAEFWDDHGTCYLYTGNEEDGIACISRALSINPRVKYGAPYLRLAAYYSEREADRSLPYIRAFQSINSSSCEAYGHLATILKKLGKTVEAKASAEEGLQIYRMLPRYKKRQERKWALRLYWKRIMG